MIESMFTMPGLFFTILGTFVIIFISIMTYFHITRCKGCDDPPEIKRVLVKRTTGNGSGDGFLIHTKCEQCEMNHYFVSMSYGCETVDPDWAKAFFIKQGFK